MSSLPMSLCNTDWQLRLIKSTTSAWKTRLYHTQWLIQPRTTQTSVNMCSWTPWADTSVSMVTGGWSVMSGGWSVWWWGWVIMQFAGAGQCYWTLRRPSRRYAAGQVRHGGRCQVSTAGGSRRHCGCETASGQGWDDENETCVWLQSTATCLITDTVSSLTVFSDKSITIIVISIIISTKWPL